jgi:hypothetical protein
MRIILNNNSIKSDIEAMNLVASVMQEGLISDFGKAYCYVTVFRSAGIVVYAKKNSETSHTFNVLDVSND